jgi:hypothetical protein
MVETSQVAKKLKKYRPVKPLPYELRDIINVYIEEQLCESFPITVFSNVFLTRFSLTSSSVTLEHTYRRH